MKRCAGLFCWFSLFYGPRLCGFWCRKRRFVIMICKSFKVTVVAMSARLAAYAATGLSILSIVFCILFVPILLSKMSVIVDQVTLEMDEFQVMTDSAWNEWIARPALSSRRHSRQVPGAPRQCRE